MLMTFIDRFHLWKQYGLILSPRQNNISHLSQYLKGAVIYYRRRTESQSGNKTLTDFVCLASSRFCGQRRQPERARKEVPK